MTDLGAWLREQIDEDERMARAADVGSDVFDGTGIIVMPNRSTGDRTITLPSHIAHHIARHDPARVLAEVAAKRTILELHSPTNEKEHGSPQGYRRVGGYGYVESACITCGTFDEYAVPWPCDTIKALAQPYAEWPGWREEWAT